MVGRLLLISRIAEDPTIPRRQAEVKVIPSLPLAATSNAQLGCMRHAEQTVDSATCTLEAHRTFVHATGTAAAPSIDLPDDRVLRKPYAMAAGWRSRPRQLATRDAINTALLPPKAKEFDITCSSRTSCRARFGT